MKYITLIILFLSALPIFAQTTSDKQAPIDAQTLVEKNDVFFLNGVPYTGPCYQNFPSGKKGMEGTYKNGKKDDVWHWYYESGAVKRETNYRNGKEHGLSIIWYKNGQKRSEIVYDNGVNIKQHRWDEEGNFLPPPVFGSN